MKRGFDNKGQVTVFVIIAVLIVVGVLAFILFRGGIDPKTPKVSPSNPQEFLESCIEPSVIEAVEKMTPQGGFINPRPSIAFDGAERGYTCYTTSYYDACVNQRPMYLDHLANEIESYVSSKVEGCFDKLKNGLEKEGYSVELDYNDFEIELNNDKINVISDVDLTYSKGGVTKSEDGFAIDINDKLYNVAIVVQEITNQEAVNEKNKQKDKTFGALSNKEQILFLAAKMGISEDTAIE